ncbi:MAG: M23 family metallopeptidase [Actinobacteria bacterium]|nr:M23 family metallopeptidase [Actinomycetota bacterium]
MRTRIRIIVVFVLALSFFDSLSANADTTYVFPVVGCKVTYSKYHHDYPATDIKTKFGCAFVAPISGVVQDVSRRDLWSGKTNRGEHRGGLSVSIIGDDGVRYYGSHLSKVEEGIDPGVRVVAGQKLGEVGRTGSARGIPKPHLHFGISFQTQPGDWEIRRGAIWPWKYLDAWRAGENLSPVKAVNRAAKKAKK